MPVYVSVHTVQWYMTIAYCISAKPQSCTRYLAVTSAQTTVSVHACNINDCCRSVQQQTPVQLIALLLRRTAVHGHSQQDFVNRTKTQFYACFVEFRLISQEQGRAVQRATPLQCCRGPCAPRLSLQCSKATAFPMIVKLLRAPSWRCSDRLCH